MATQLEHSGQDSRPHVVIVGAGFGGLYTARTLHNAPVNVTLIDRTNHHVFQPLLYQVATGSLAPEQITATIRHVVHRQHNTDVLMAEVTGVDTQNQRVLMDDRSLSYDYLVLATGSRHSYFGHPEWEQFAPGLKTISDANAVRRNILLALEAAEVEPDPEKRRALLTFVCIGAGPTGVEMAGQIAEMTRVALANDFRHINTQSARVILLDGAPRILPTFDASLAEASAHYLEQHGVEIRVGRNVENVTAEGVQVGGEFIRAGAMLWAAGNMASPAGKWLGMSKEQLNKAGQIKIEPDCTAPGLPNVYVIGDTSSLLQEEKPLPGVAQVPIQQGKYIAKQIIRRVKGQTALPPFRYFDKGNMATVGRKFAIYDLNALETPGGKKLTGHLRFSGFLMWLLWLGIHVTYLVGFANRFLVMLQWGWSYLTFSRQARLITPDYGPNAANAEALDRSKFTSSAPTQGAAPAPAPPAAANSDRKPDLAPAAAK